MAIADRNTQSPSPLEAVRKLAPLVRAHAAETEAARELPRVVFEALADAGLFHLLIPRDRGGGELDLPSYVELIGELGQADASTAWAVNQGTVWATYAALFPPDQARAIWIDPPRAVVANSPAPTGRADVVEGGYRVSARQGFSTGCRHATWLAANAQVYENRQPRQLPDGKPDQRYLLVPVSQAEILDTWHVRGMRGTGTHDFAVNDVFVPAWRTVLVSASTAPEVGPLYVLPRTQVFATGDAAIALGVARASLDVFVELAGAKKPRQEPRLLRELATVQDDVGRLEAELQAARALLRTTVRDVWQTVCETRRVDQAARVALRVATSHALRAAVPIVDTVYHAAGATAVYEDHPLQRYFQDIHVISQHLQARRRFFEQIGRFYLGLDSEI